MNDPPNIVLVHGASADGSSWSAVIERLQADGHTVTAPQFPLTSLADNVARLRQVLARQTGPTIVVGHSYGGQIITALSGHEEGLGTVGLPEGKLPELSREAGFSSVRRVPLENPFNNLYELRP